jgi:hypothetical protein
MTTTETTLANIRPTAFRIVRFSKKSDVVRPRGINANEVLTSGQRRLVHRINLNFAGTDGSKIHQQAENDSRFVMAGEKLPGAASRLASRDPGFPRRGEHGGYFSA